MHGAGAAAQPARERAGDAADHQVARDEHAPARAGGDLDGPFQRGPARGGPRRDRPPSGAPQRHARAQPRLAGGEVHVAAGGAARGEPRAQPAGDRAGAARVRDAHDRRPAGTDAGGRDDQPHPRAGACGAGGSINAAAQPAAATTTTTSMASSAPPTARPKRAVMSRRRGGVDGARASRHGTNGLPARARGGRDRPGDGSQPVVSDALAAGRLAVHMRDEPPASAAGAGAGAGRRVAVVAVEREERYWYPDDGSIVWVAGYTPVDPDSGRYLARNAVALSGRGLIVAGVAGARRFHDDVLQGDAVSPGRRLILRREPANEHDANAIAVLAAGGAQAGWVPREVAAHVAPGLDAGEPWAAVVLRERRASPRDPRSGLTMLLAPAAAIELRERPAGGEKGA